MIEKVKRLVEIAEEKGYLKELNRKEKAKVIYYILKSKENAGDN